MSNFLKMSIAVAVTATLVACGGGGGGDSTPATTTAALTYTVNGVQHTEATLGLNVGSGETVTIVTSQPITTAGADTQTSGLCVGGAPSQSAQTYTFNYTGYCAREIVLSTAAGQIHLGVTVGNAGTAINTNTGTGTTATGTSTGTNTGTTTGTGTGAGGGTILPAGTTASDGSTSLGNGLCRRPATDAEWAALGGAGATGGGRPNRTYPCPA